MEVTVEELNVKLIKDQIEALRKSGFFDKYDVARNAAVNLVNVAGKAGRLNDMSMRVLLVFPHGVIPLTHQARFIRARNSERDVQDRQTPHRHAVDNLEKNLRTYSDQLKQLKDSPQKDKQTVHQLEQTIADLNDQIRHLKTMMNEIASDNAPISISFPCSIPSDSFADRSLGLPTDKPYLIYETFVSQTGYSIDDHSDDDSEMPRMRTADELLRVKKQFETEHTRGLTAAEGIAMGIHFPHSLEGSHHIDLLGCQMQIMNLAGRLSIMEAPRTRTARPAFTYAYCRR